MFGKKKPAEPELGPRGKTTTMLRDFGWIDKCLADNYEGGKAQFERDLEGRGMSAVIDGLDAMRVRGKGDDLIALFLRRYWYKLSEETKFEAILGLFGVVKEDEAKSKAP